MSLGLTTHDGDQEMNDCAEWAFSSESEETAGEVKDGNGKENAGKPNAKADNITAGGEWLSKKKLRPMYVYMACKSRLVEPEDTVVGTLREKRKNC